jgi:hypothetical protein
MTFQVDAAAYERPVELLEAYRRDQPRAQMSDLMRHIKWSCRCDHYPNRAPSFKSVWL